MRLVFLATLIASANAICTECIELIVGPAFSAGGPTGKRYDSPFNAITLGGKCAAGVRGFSANQESYRVFDGASLDESNASFLSRPSSVGLTKTRLKTDLDFCGSWLNSAVYEPETGIVRGFYHEEKDCDYSRNDFTNKSIAYAESHDCGLTFKKVSSAHLICRVLTI